MLSILKKEINLFFSSLIGYIVISTFLIYLGLFLWVFPDTSLLDSTYATLDGLFGSAPFIFLALIPAITMRSFAEENQAGTMELLVTRPVSELQIILGKYFACVLLVLFALLPTLLYFYTVYQLSSPVGNMDTGAAWGSYFGLFLLGASFTAIGIFASAITNNQIVAFILAVFLCFFCYLGFSFFSKLPDFFGRLDSIIEQFGIDYHYNSISRGLVDSRDILYFFSLISAFIAMTYTALERRKW